MRRDSSDIQWQHVKEEVRLRDRGADRLLKVITLKEGLLLQKKAPRALLLKLDAAHIFPVSIYPDIMYNKDNIITLNRYSHENLDNMRHPITGEPITYEERQSWWEKIAGSQWERILKYLDKELVNTLQ